MSEYVFFSPIGDSDPIRACHDAAMLHICRRYKPKYICLYLTAEMVKNHYRDDRYCKGIRALYEAFGFQPEVEIIERPEITAPQMFDQFDDDFRSITLRLHNEHPECELIANISSGTPSIKSSVKTVAATSIFPVRCVQVSAPIKKDEESAGAVAREVVKPGEIFDFDLFWETNEDNAPDHTDRTFEPDSENFIALFIKENVCRYAEAYDYHAALMESERIREFLPDEAVSLLEGANERMRLIGGALSKHLGAKTAGKIISPRPGDKMQIIEYVLWLDIKYKRRDISDYIRGLTPALFNLSLEYLAKGVGFGVKQYCVDEYGVKKLSRRKLSEDDEGRKILDMLDLSYNGAFRDNSPLSPELCLKIIDFKTTGKSDETRDVLIDLRDIEKRIRNATAHEIIPLDDAKVKRETGLTFDEIHKLTQKAAERILGMTSNDWKSYDRINEMLRDLFKQRIR